MKRTRNTEPLFLKRMIDALIAEYGKPSVNIMTKILECFAPSRHDSTRKKRRKPSAYFWSFAAKSAWDRCSKWWKACAMMANSWRCSASTTPHPRIHNHQRKTLVNGEDPPYGYGAETNFGDRQNSFRLKDSQIPLLT